MCDMCAVFDECKQPQYPVPFALACAKAESDQNCMRSKCKGITDVVIPAYLCLVHMT